AAVSELQRNAVSPVVRDDRTTTRTEDLVQVVVEQQTVVSHGVALALRFVRETESGEVQNAHPALLREQRNDVVPVDAARRQAVHEQHEGRVWAAELSVKDLSSDRATPRIAWPPPKEPTAVEPLPRTAIHHSATPLIRNPLRRSPAFQVVRTTTADGV